MIRPSEAGDPRKWRGAARGAEHFSPPYLVFVTTGEVVSLARVCARNEKRVNRGGGGGAISRKAMSGRVPDDLPRAHPSSLSVSQIILKTLRVRIVLMNLHNARYCRNTLLRFSLSFVR